MMVMARAGLRAGPRAGWMFAKMAVNWLDYMVGKMADCCAEMMVVTRVGSRAG